MIQENISLKSYNTFGIDARARFFAPFSKQDELLELLSFAKGPAANMPAMVLGGGSNILFTRDFDGLVMKNEIRGIEKVKENDDHIYIRAGAGENWHRFVMHCLDMNYAGVENLALIPGNVGASPMQNIGAYGVELKDVFDSLEAMHIRDKKPVLFSHADCEFGYRESVFKNKYRDQFIITHVTYRLNKKPTFNTSYGAIEEELSRMKTEKSISAIAHAVMHIRSSKLPDPAVIGNAGSFFKNPEVEPQLYEALKLSHPNIVAYPLPNGHLKLAAGWLIEQCGWKGYRIGDAGCHEKQALVLVNYGNAKGNEIFALSEKIQKDVYEKFGVRLQREVNVI
jgi:UDP-N-acetylmuramate dehydrogenase